MDNKKELKSEELEKVTGGIKKPGTDGIDTDGQFGCFMSMYHLTTGNEYYFVWNDTSTRACTKRWFRARVDDSYEEELAYGATRHKHKLTVTEQGTSSYSGTIELESNKYAAYITKHWD